MPDLAIVIPAWNERDNLELLLPALKDTLAELGLNAEIVVADAGSHDGTEETVKRKGARLVVQKERGYGGALLAGFAATTAPYIVTMDADLSHRPVFLADFWDKRNHADVLIASRYVAGGSAEMGRFRRVLSYILNTTYRRILSVPVRDLSSGFRMYRRDVVASMNLEARDFDVLEEILVRAHVGGRRIHEVPFAYMARGSGSSHARLFKFGVAYLRTLGRMRRLRYTGGQTEDRRPETEALTGDRRLETEAPTGDRNGHRSSVLSQPPGLPSPVSRQSPND